MQEVEHLEVHEEQFAYGACNALAEALAKAQGEMENPPKTKTVTIRPRGGAAYQYSYTPLEEVLDAIRAPLSENGLALTQLVIAGPEHTALVTRLIHTSGQSIESRYPLPRNAGSQDMGSAITYARRYSLCSMLGIAGETDDDAQQAEQASAGTTETERDHLVERMGEAGIGNRALLLALGLEDARTVSDLTPAQVTDCLNRWDEVAKAAKSPQRPAAPPTGELTPVEPIQRLPAESDGINPKLLTLMKKNGISAGQLRAYVSPKFFPAETALKDLPPDFIDAITKPDNWAKALKHMQEAK